MSRPLNQHRRGCICDICELEKGAERRARQEADRLSERLSLVVRWPMRPDESGHYWVWS